MRSLTPVATSRCGGLVLGWRVPRALDPEQDGWIRADRDCVRRRGQVLDEFDVGLFVALEIDRFLAFSILESKNHPPQPRVFRLRMGNGLVVALARDVTENKERQCPQGLGITISLAKGGALELGEIPEPPDA